MTVVTRTELKTYLALTTSADDALLDQLLLDAQAQAERDTGRVFAAASNTSRTYSTDGQTLVGIRDVPASDPSRVVTWNGVTLVEGTSYWLLPDRRDPRISTTLQMEPFDTTGGAAYKRDPMWFDKNLDRLWARGSLPNDLTLAGIEGHPFPHDDVKGGVKLLAAWMYWRAKSGASGTVTVPTGDVIELNAEPIGYREFVRRWKVYQGVAAI